MVTISKDNTMSLGIVVPVYKNASSLPGLFQELSALESQTRKWKVKQEIIFVIDGSPDNSLEIIQNEKKIKGRKNWTILSLTKNFGQQICKIPQS
jgi:dolichol-phosphate mannosyltransferase